MRILTEHKGKVYELVRGDCSNGCALNKGRFSTDCDYWQRECPGAAYFRDFPGLGGYNGHWEELQP